MTSLQERKLQLVQDLQDKLKKAIKEYKNLENFECLPIVPVALSESLSSDATPLTTLQNLSPPENTSSLDWKSVAGDILDQMAAHKSLLLSPESAKSLLQLSNPSSIAQIRDQMQQGTLTSLEQVKEAIGVLLFASSLHLGSDEEEKREKLVQLFDHLM